MMNALLELIRDLFKEKKYKLNCVVQCVVTEMNVDSSVNLYILPDVKNVINGVANPFKIYCEIGDVVFLYKPNNNLNVSFIIANKTRRDKKIQISGGGVIYGITGKIGPTGNIGPTGKKGADGISGYDGGSGHSGSKGKGGKNGANGKDGADGPQGSQGSQGASGKDGINGKDGADGPQGSQGPQGASGKDGVNGKDGPIGPTGATGPEGPRGDSVGPTGPPGEKGLQGSSAETNGTAIIYFNPDEGLLQDVEIVTESGTETLKLIELVSMYEFQYNYFVLVNKNNTEEKYSVNNIDRGFLSGDVEGLTATYESYVKDETEFATDVYNTIYGFAYPFYKIRQKTYQADLNSNTLIDELPPHLTIYLRTKLAVEIGEHILNGAFGGTAWNILNDYINQKKKFHLTLIWCGEIDDEGRLRCDCYSGYYSYLENPNTFLGPKGRKLKITNDKWSIQIP